MKTVTMCLTIILIAMIGSAFCGEMQSSDGIKNLSILLAQAEGSKSLPVAEKVQPSAKNIYYEPGYASGAPAQQQAAVRFWVDLYPRNEQGLQTVTADHTFYSGDRTRFRVATNLDCFVYVAYEGSTGERALLFPALDAGMNNRVVRHQAKIMPTSEGYFTFDNNPGREKIVVVCSPTQIPELDAIAQNRRQSRSINLTSEENQAFSKFLREQTGDESNGSTKNIVYEPENSGPQVGGYYCQPNPGFTKPIIISITLKHR